MLRKILLSSALFLVPSSVVFSSTIFQKQASDPEKLNISTVQFSGPLLTLRECYDLAMHQSESLKNQEELIEQAQARARGSLGNALPHLSWILTDLLQDTNGAQGQGGGVGGTLTRSERIEHRFNLDQTLFSGLREYSATKGFKKESARDEFLFRRAQINLFNDVAIAFYSVILEESQLGNTRAALKVAQDRIVELKDRIKLGKSRESELLSAQSQVAVFKSREAVNMGSVANTRDSLSFIIGKDVSNRPLQDELPGNFNIPSLDEALTLAENRSDVRAQREDTESKRYLVRYTKGNYYPSVDLSANYYTRRVGFQDGIDWDALFTLDVPFYQGGTVAANTRAARSELRQSENNLSLILRDVRTQVRQSRTSLLASMQEAEELEEAFRTAKRSAELQVREYRLGLVNNLEVLSALDSALITKQALDEAQIRKKLDFLELKVNTEEDLNQ